MYILVIHMQNSFLFVSVTSTVQQDIFAQLFFFCDVKCHTGNWKDFTLIPNYGYFKFFSA